MFVMLKGEIIAVGTELLLGQIANTNAQYVSKKMAEIGVPIYFHVTVGDNEKRLAEAIQQAQARADLLIFIGGLGPTQDDLTKETAAKLLNKKMVLDQATYDKIVSFFANRGIIMSENNKKQAMVLEESTVFPNDFGLAAGIGLSLAGINYCFLPGPPSELIPMVDKYLLPWLKKLFQGNVFYSQILRFSGIGEALLEETIIDLIEKQTNPTVAPLANDGEVTIRLTASAKNEEEAQALIAPVEKEILSRLQKYHYGNGDDSIEQEVYKILRKNGLTLSFAESCTGGLISSQFTAISGSSEVYKGGIVCYQDEIKQQIVKVKPETLKKHGAVSPETAASLAEGCSELFGSDIALAITGVAGPNALEDKPVGLIYLAISEKGQSTKVREVKFAGNRQYIQNRAARFSFFIIWEYLNERLK